MAWFLFILIVGGLAFYFATPDERASFFRACWRLARLWGAEAIRRVTRRPDDDGQPAPPMAFVTSAIVLVNLYVFVRMLFGAGAFGDPETLVSWGASVGPRTTNGEWWRLVTAAFVHGGWLHLAAVLAGLIQIGCLTERIVGRFAFATVYVAAAILANLAYLSRTPITVVAGASASVLGIYGLLAATYAWGWLRGSPVSLPWHTVKRVLPGVVLFLVYNAAAHRLDRSAAIAAFVAGSIIGLVLARGARDHRPAARRVAALTAATAILAVVLAVPLSGMADVRPAIDRVIAAEERTATAYEAILVRFNKGAIPALAVAQFIDGTIVPELQASRAAVEALERVPRDHRAVVSLAHDYLRLRDESWHLRSEGLRLLKMRTLQEAQRKEWQALEILKKVRDLKQAIC